MKGSERGKKTSRRTLLIEIVLLVLLVGVALYLWTNRQRADESLKTASLAELQEAAKNDPYSVHTFYYLGQKQEQAGELAAAYESYSHAAALDPDNADNWLASARLAGQLTGDQGALAGGADGDRAGSAVGSDRPTDAFRACSYLPPNRRLCGSQSRLPTVQPLAERGRAAMKDTPARPGYKSRV